MTRDRSFAPEVMAMNLVPYMRALQQRDGGRRATKKRYELASFHGQPR